MARDMARPRPVRMPADVPGPGDTIPLPPDHHGARSTGQTPGRNGNEGGGGGGGGGGGDARVVTVDAAAAPAKNANSQLARRGGLGGPPPPDDYRFDPSVELEELADWTKPNDEKHRQQMADDRVRLPLLNDAALTREQKEAKDAGYKACQFNQFISDQLSLHRRGTDTRNYKCYNQK